MEDSKTIVDVLFDEMRKLYKECSYLRDFLKSLSVQEELTLKKRRSELDDCMSLIRVHQELKNTNLQEVDFYSKFKQHFYNNKSNKRVRFIVIDGFENEEELDDAELIKRHLMENNKDLDEERVSDSEEFKKQFVIKNCLPVMELVPIQFASNARKYMPQGTIVTVALVKTTERNFITVSNLGPTSEREEIKTILALGGRGKNTSIVKGMGLGLKQVKEIMNMHKSWLDTTFSVTQSDAVFHYENVPYSMFTVKFSFLNGANNQLINTDFLQWSEDFWGTNLPRVIVHNMFSVSYHLSIFCEKKLMSSFQLKDEKDKKELKYIKTRLSLVKNQFDDILRQCLYKIYLDEDDDNLVDAIMGNEKSLNIHDIIDNTFKNLVSIFYSYKMITYDVKVNQQLRKINVHTSFYSFICGIFTLILDNVPKNSFFEITYDGGRKDNQVTIKCEQCDFKTIFNDDVSDLIGNQVSMYKDMLGEWNGAFIVQNHSLKIMV